MTRHKNTSSDLTIEQQYVNTTYEMINKVGVEGISAREIAKRLKRTAPAVYRHFESIDHLIAVASVRFLKPYYDDMNDIAQNDPNPIILDTLAWECFAYYAFNNAAIFEILFMRDSGMASKAVKKYYELFPDEIGVIKDYIRTAASIADLPKRDAMVLNLAAEQGIIEQNAVDYLVDIDIYVFYGMLYRYRNSNLDADKAREATRRYVRMIANNYAHVLLPGNDEVSEFLKRYT